MNFAKLGSCCIKIGSGATPKGGASVYVESGVALIRSQNVYNLAFSYNGLTHIADNAAKKLAAVTVASGDVLLNITGDSVARVCMVPDDTLPARVNQHVAIIRTNKDLSPMYLMYYLASPYMQSYMLNLASGKGASRNALTKGMIEEFLLPLPSIEEQLKISSILSAYDDLIENNNRRIMILEQMAENLYKEWFVRFRFPGHEQTEFENGIPKGWETKRLGDELEVKRGGSPRPIHEYISDTGLKWLKISDATQSDNPYIVNIEESIIEEGLKKTVYLKAGSLVLSNSATPGLPRILTIDSCIHDGWLYFPKKKLSNEYLYLLFNHIRPHLLSKGNGAIFTNLKTDILKRYLFTKPTDIVLSLFNDLVKPIFGQIYSLTMKNQNLTKQRDMLLPRLMSGKLEV